MTICLDRCFLNLSVRTDHLKVLLNIDSAFIMPGLLEQARVSLANKLPGDAGPAGPRDTLRTARPLDISTCQSRLGSYKHVCLAGGANEHS